MVEWWTWVCVGVASALGGIALTSCYLWHRHFNHHVRKRVLSDSTPLWGCGSVLHTVSFLRLGEARAARDCPELEAAVKAATDAVARHGGRVRYVGRAVMVVPCEPFTDEHGFDVVLLCAWPSGDATAAAAWRADALVGAWERDVSQCWWRNVCVNLIMSVVAMSLFKLWTVLTCSTFSVVEPAAIGGAGGAGADGSEAATTPYSSMDGADGGDTRHLVGDDHKLTADNMARMASFVDEQGEADDGILIFNLLNDSESTRADKRADAIYASQMMRMLARHGGGIMHLGGCYSMGTEARDGEWRMHAAVHYPGRAFFSKLARSRWMAETVQGKKPGKSIACITWPFFPTGERAVCLQNY
eukprot:g6407.t1